MKKFTSLSLVNTLLIGLLAVIPVSIMSATPAHAVSCASGMTAQNNLKADPAHGQVFYIDSGVTPKVDAAYVGYKISYTAASGTIKGLWAELSNFTGGKISLANPSDKFQQLPDITAGAANYKTSYFLLKAISATTSAQTHTLKIYDRRPDLNGASALLTCDFSFSQVQETIKASANKINTVSASLNTTTATLGGTLTVSVDSANTGKVGSGKAPDFSLFWVSPAAVSTWPTRSLRLEKVTLNLSCTGSSTYKNNVLTLTDTLSLSNAKNYCFDAASTWTSSYVFRIIGPGPASLTPYPVAMIASGTQYKHSDISGLSFGTTVDLSGVSSSAFTVTVSASSSVISSTSSNAVIEYTVTLHTTSSADIYVDEVIDNVANGVTFVTGTAKLNGSSISDPIYLASESTLSPPPLHYIGPFTVNSSADTTIVYRMNVPCAASSATYKNVVYAKIGDQILGSSTTQLSAAVVTTLSGASSCSASTSTTTDNITPSGQTYPATNVSSSGSSSSATLNGFANAYGQSNVTYRFRYSLDSNLVNSTTLTTSTSITGSSPQSVSASISGLSINKTYYFRIEVSYVGGTVNGTILSFVTPDVLASPSVLTGAISNLSGSGNNYSVTLSGTINPHLNTLTPLSFEICASAASTCTSTTMPSSPTAANTKNILVDNGSGSAGNLTLSGSGDYSVNSDNIDGTSQFTGLNSNTTYYYRIKAVCDAVVTTYCPNTSTSFYGAIRTFTIGAPIVTTTAATTVARTTATVNGTYDANGAGTPTYYFAYCISGTDTCSSSSVSGTSLLKSTTTSGSGLNGTAVSANLTSLSANTTYYFQLLGLTGDVVKSYGDILSFTTLDITTSSLPGGVVNVSYSTSVVGSGGSGSYSFSETGLPAGLSISTSGVISGTPTATGTSSSVQITINDLVYNTSYTKTFSITIIGVTTSAANSIGATSATTNGSSSVSLTTPEFCYSAIDPGGSFDISTCTKVTASGTNSAYSGSLTSLNASTTYYFQLTGVYSGTQYYGSVLSFKTAPTVTTAAASSITISSATIGGSATEALTTPKLCYSTTNPSGNFDPATCTTPTVAGTYTGYTGSLTGLSSSTTYYFQLTGIVSGVSYFGTVNSFKTLPVATTSSASSITATDATLNGSITETATAGAFCFSTSNPSPSNFTYGGSNCLSPLVATDAGSNNFTFSKSGLNASTTYYFQFFGTVGGTRYNGVIQSFTTLPTVTTSSASSVATTTARLNGSSTETLTDPKFCLSETDPGATFSSCGSPLSATAGASNTYSYNSTGLTPNRTYYFQLYGTVGGATYSGSVLSFTTVATYTIDVTQTSNGTISPDDTVVASGANQSFTITPSTGYHIVAVTVDGTNVGTGGTYSFSNVTANHTITATFAIDTFTVTYFSTNADGSPTAPVDSSSPYNYGSTVTVKAAPSPAWTRTGYTFSGWNTESNGTGIDRAFNSTFVITANTNLYPHWVLDGSKTVTFHKNDGVTPETTSSQSASSATNLQSNTFTRSGYAFANWNTDPLAGAGGTSYANGASYSFAANLDLYAQWNQIFTITFNSNGGSVTPNSTQCTNNVDCNVQITLPTSAGTKTHYTFQGWTVSCNTGTVLTGSYSITSTLTLCAYWTADPTYTVTYNGNSNTTGTVPVDSTLYYAGDTVTVSSATLTRTGYTRDGWYSNSTGIGGSVYSGTFVMGNANVIIYAKWDINSYKVTYFDNGSTGGSVPAEQTANYNTSVTISTKNTLVKDGYTFQYWNKDSTDAVSGTRYNAGANYTIPAENTSLYAIWAVQSSFTVTFHGEGNTGGATGSQSYNGTTNLTLNGFTKTGYSFNGWATTSGGSKQYDDGSSYNFNANGDLYAKWTINSYALSYDCNNGSGAPTSHSGDYNTNLTVKSNTCTYSGYTFQHWGTTSSGGTTYAELSTYTIPAENKTLYAIWQAVSSGGGGGGAPAPVITPRIPTINFVAGKEVCANGVTLVIEGRNLAGASVTFDGVAVKVASSTDTQLVVELPAGGIGSKTLKVFNADGSAATSIKYVLVDSPVYYNFLYPETYKDSPFSYTFAATNAFGYAIEGTMPNGLWLNEATGEIYGTPSKEGNFLFTLVALNPCGNSYLDVYMFVDKPIPPNYTCNVDFKVPTSNTITPGKVDALKNCLSRILTLAPATIDPVIFLSGGVPLGSSIDQMIAHPRYRQIVDIIDSMKIIAQIYVGAFVGPVDQVQVMVYWPVPIDV